MSDAETATGAGESFSLDYPRPLVAWFMVAALFVAYIFSFIDRMIIGLLVEPMKADLGISDTEISLLQGFSFALFYTIAGIPIGRLIDRTNRTRVVAAGIGVWSFMTMLCGMASHYWQLFLIRMGVGVGEATLSPAAYSMIADSFPAKRLGLAMGIYALGSAVGAGLAFMIGGAIIAYAASGSVVGLGFLGELKAWQATFLLVGAPGLLVALVFVFLPEPVRRAPKNMAQPPLSEVVTFLRSKAGSLLNLFMAVSLLNLANFAAISWLPVLFMRVHGFELDHAGYTAGGALVIGGLIGLVGGGLVADRYEGGAAAGRIKLCAITSLIGFSFAFVFPIAPSPWVSVVAFCIFFSCSAVPIGAAASAIQQATPNAMRATVSAIYLFIVNLIGLGIGPTLVAGIGDLFFPTPTGIRYAILIVSPLSVLIAAGLFYLSLKSFRRLASA